MWAPIGSGADATTAFSLGFLLLLLPIYSQEIFLKHKIMTLSCTKPSSLPNSSSSNLEQSLKSSSWPVRSCNHLVRPLTVSPNLIHSATLPLVTLLPPLGLGAGRSLSLKGSLRDVTVTFVQMSHQRGLPLSKIGPTPYYSLPQPPRVVFIVYPLPCVCPQIKYRLLEDRVFFWLVPHCILNI